MKDFSLSRLMDDGGGDGHLLLTSGAFCSMLHKAYEESERGWLWSRGGGPRGCVG